MTSSKVKANKAPRKTAAKRAKLAVKRSGKKVAAKRRTR